jgi:queuine/archaeosine tRNA-ribosyltransferase
VADICIVYLSEDEAIVARLVRLLKKRWDVWWAQDIAHGDWEEAVRSEIPKALALVPILSKHANSKRMAILKDEMRFAQQQNKPIFPFLIGPADIPFGFGDLNHTKAHGWNGAEWHPGYKQLQTKLTAIIGSGHKDAGKLARMREVTFREKTLRLPTFAFSLSSHETQVTPREGATLLGQLGPDAVMISAYDVYRDRSLHSAIKLLHDTESVLLLDSGNYEAYRKDNRYSPKGKPFGWRKQHFWYTAAEVSPDLAFCFDTITHKGRSDQIAKRIITDFHADDRALQKRSFPLCPIIHCPSESNEQISTFAARIVSKVAAELDPIMLAIPERELGDGIRERVSTVRDIRNALNALGKYYPLHILGTGNPLSIVALAAAGADVFDGLEWCRTVAEYTTGRLFHFQHFDCFNEACLNQVQDQRIRLIIQNPNTSYAMKTLSYNVDFFKDTTRTMQNMIHSGQAETLLRNVPNIGSTLFKDINT